jgi:response regulator RpfG family c-di-GMP phosphodiesterase
MRICRQQGITVDWQPPDRNGQNWSKHNGDTSAIHSFSAQESLGELLASSIVLTEDFEKLPAQTQNEIKQCSETQKLLPLLVQHGLLTEYQACRVEAGTTYGLILGNYRVLDRLGAGGMGVVFKAEHTVMRRPVAIKVLSSLADSDSRIQQRFLTEIRAVGQLQHPNIVAAMDAGQISGPASPTLRYFVMEFVPGQDLERYVNANGPLSPVKACDVIHQVAAALAESHKHNLVHRDIKPSNILLNPDSQAKLLDFGLARHFSHRVTDPGTVLGTLDFMAPEQVGNAGSVDIRADIYALGGTLFWCLTGRFPFSATGNLVQQVANRQTQTPPSVRTWRPEIPTELDAIVTRMMALCPDDRYATPREVMQALLPFLKPEMRDNFVHPVERLSGQSGGESNKRDHQILIVDDEPEIRRFCRFVLEAEDGPRCDEAANGVFALEMIGAKRYDLVLSDIDMPEMTGPEVCRHLRSNPPCPNLKIVMMSGRATPDEMARMLLNGADDYLAKPLSIVQLQSKVEAALCLKDAQDRADLLNSHLLAANHELEQSLTASSSDLAHARNGLVRALAKLVEYREGETGSRLLRMEHYARCLAEEAGKALAFAGQIDANFIELLVCCAPLLDIGKVGLPDHILLKPGKLEPDERILMQTHTTIGADALKAVMKQHGSGLEFLQMAVKIAHYHHERYDGEGYPDRLAGGDIPLSARLVAICDVYDALRSRRTYKPALSHSTAIQVMTTVSRGQFDPYLFQSFQCCAPKFDQIFRELGN